MYYHNKLIKIIIYIDIIVIDCKYKIIDYIHVYDKFMKIINYTDIIIIDYL